MFEEFEKPKGAKEEVPVKKEDKEGLPAEASAEAGEFHIMPTGLRGGKVVVEKKPPIPTKPSKPGAGMKYYLILGIIVVLVLGGLIGGVFFWYRKALIDEQKPGPPTPLENTGPPPHLNGEPEESEEKNLQVSIKDKEGKLVGRAEFFLPAGAIDIELEPEISGRLPGPDEQFQGQYKIVGPIYEFTPAKFDLLKSATLKLYYQKDLVDKTWEPDLKIAYFKAQQWRELTGRQDISKNLITTSFKKLPGDLFALVVLREKLIQETHKEEIAPHIPSTLDRDKDGLTDLEEEIYQTDVLNPDTDGDTYPDGLEIVNIYSPLTGPGVRISVSGLVSIYTSSGYDWSIFYPVAWPADVLPETEEREVIFTSNTGEFIEVAVQENPEGLSAFDWYLKQYPALDPAELKRTKLAGEPAVWSVDGLTLYMTQGDKIYVLTYNIGAATKLNFRSTFAMMLRSFRIPHPESMENGE